MSNVEQFDEKHGSEAVGFYVFLNEAGAFDLTDPEQRRLAEETSAFMALATDERPRTTHITDELVKKSGTVVHKIVPPSI